MKTVISIEKLPVSLNKKFEAIAKKHLMVDTLKVQNSDRLDFHDCSVTGIKNALLAAYNLGRESTGPKV